MQFPLRVLVVLALAAHPGDAAVKTGEFNEAEEPNETANWKAGAIGAPLNITDPAANQCFYRIATLP